MGNKKKIFQGSARAPSSPGTDCRWRCFFFFFFVSSRGKTTTHGARARAPSLAIVSGDRVGTAAPGSHGYDRQKMTTEVAASSRPRRSSKPFCVTAAVGSVFPTRQSLEKNLRTIIFYFMFAVYMFECDPCFLF